MGLRELSVAVHQLRSSLSDDDETHDDGLLGTFICQKFSFVHALKLHASVVTCCICSR